MIAIDGAGEGTSISSNRPQSSMVARRGAGIRGRSPSRPPGEGEVRRTWVRQYRHRPAGVGGTPWSGQPWPTVSWSSSPGVGRCTGSTCTGLALGLTGSWRPSAHPPAATGTEPALSARQTHRRHLGAIGRCRAGCSTTPVDLLMNSGPLVGVMAALLRHRLPDGSAPAAGSRLLAPARRYVATSDGTVASGPCGGHPDRTMTPQAAGRIVVENCSVLALRKITGHPRP
jgi:hypothetical protein